MQESNRSKLNDNRIDRFGAVASSLCALHCALCSLLPAALSALGLGLLLSHKVEWFLSLGAIAFASWALVLGWRLHRSILVSSILVLGIIGLLASRALEAGSEHHDHSDEHHAAETSHNATEDDEHQKDHHSDEDHTAAHIEDDHSDDHHSEDDNMHSIGAAVGITAGLLLFVGHLLNIRVGNKYTE